MHLRIREMAIPCTKPAYLALRVDKDVSENSEFIFTNCNKIFI